MDDHLPSLRVPPVLFAHRGARAHAPENTIEAFTLALRLGATGLESDVWRTADGAAVLDHDGLVRRGLRRVPIGEIERSDLPDAIPTLEELYEACGTEVELSLDVKDPAAVDEVLRTARGAGATERLWLCHPDLDLLASWRDASEAVRLVHSTRIGAIGKPEPHAARLRDLRVDAVNLHHSEWSGGMVALYHRFRRFTLGWDAQHERVIRSLLAAGIDGVFSDHVDRMVDVADAIGRDGDRAGPDGDEAPLSRP
jgi:glycerophosphoryl diester phosphodiesterase